MNFFIKLSSESVDLTDVRILKVDESSASRKYFSMTAPFVEVLFENHSHQQLHRFVKWDASFTSLKKDLEERFLSEKDLPIVQRFITSLDLDYFHYFVI